MEENIEKKLIKFLNDKYNLDINFLEIQPTNEQFKGDITIIIFPLFKFFKKQMNKVAAEIGNFLIKNFEETKNSELNIFFVKLNKLMNNFMQENSINLILDKKNIVMANNKNDISNDILNLINKK